VAGLVPKEGRIADLGYTITAPSVAIAIPAPEDAGQTGTKPWHTWSSGYGSGGKMTPGKAAIIAAIIGAVGTIIAALIMAIYSSSGGPVNACKSDHSSVTNCSIHTS